MQDAHQKLNDIGTVLLSILSSSDQYFGKATPSQMRFVLTVS